MWDIHWISNVVSKRILRTEITTDKQKTKKKKKKNPVFGLIVT